MKIRNGFVSNGSSSTFIIWNNSEKIKTIVDLIKENPQIIECYKENHFSSKNTTQKRLMQSAEKYMVDSENPHREFMTQKDNIVVFTSDLNEDADGSFMEEVLCLSLGCVTPQGDWDWAIQPEDFEDDY